MNLLKAIRTVSRMESSSLRQGIFDDIASRSILIRIVLSVHSICRHLGISHLLVALYGLAYYLRAVMPTTTPRWLAIAYFTNEIKQLNDLDALMGKDKPVRITWSLKQRGSWLDLLRSLTHVKDVVRFIRIFGKIERRLRFMPACRVAVAWFLYIRFRHWLDHHRVHAVVVTSDYSPDAAAFSSAAASLGITRIYMPHALPSLYIKGRTLIDYEYYIFDSRAMRDRFNAMWPLTGTALYRGIRGIQRPIARERLASSNMRIGIFLSGPTDIQVLTETIRGLQRLTPKTILIRGHPVSFSNPDFTALERLSPEVKISRGTTLLQDADACDLIIAPNTTAFLETLKFGIASAYLSTLDFLPEDYNGFVKDSLLPAITSAQTLDIEAIKAFFAPPWEERMAYFDEAYSHNIEDLQKNVKSTLLAVIGS